MLPKRVCSPVLKWLRLKSSITIIGGGIAGVSAACQISRSCDADVTIVNKHDVGFPSKSSAFTFSETVKRHRLEKAVLRYYSKVGLYSLLGSKVTYELGSPELAVVDYAIACKELLLSAKNSQIHVLSHTLAKKVRKDNGRVLVELEGDSNSILECDLLIDASGTSFITANFFQFQIPHFFSHAYGFQLNHCEIPDDQLDEIAFFMGRSTGSGGGWFYPITNAECRFGVATVSSEPKFPAAKLNEYYERAKRSMYPFSRMMRNSEPRLIQAGSIPAEAVKNLVANNIMRVGDAAGHATPHMMEGIRPCIESGISCGMVAAEAYKRRNFSERLLRKYERLWRRKFKMQYLYLLSEAELTFSQDDMQVEKSIGTQARNSNKANPKTYLKGLGGTIDFPLFLFRPPTPRRLKILTKFVQNNISWLVQ
jgi:flavin-dependent dehydrogenase